jgi:hypothetical protein
MNDHDTENGEGLDEDPGEELESRIEHADHAFASESFGTTAAEQEEGEPLDQRLAEEQPERPITDVELAIADVDAPDDEPELVAEATYERDTFVAPEEAAMTVRDRAPGAVDHADDEYTELYDESEATD